MLRRLRAETAHHAVFLLLAGVYGAIVLAVLAATGRGGLPLLGDYLVTAALPPALIVAFRAFGELMRHALHVRPFRWASLGADLRRSEIFSSARIAAAVWPMIVFPIFSTLFTTFKVAIPVLAPFSWDPLFMRIDRVLHGGVDPWVWLQPWLGHPAITSAISYLYNLWIPLMWLVIYWQIVSIADRSRRMRLLLSYLLTWAVLGSGAAVALSSAGPCFYGAVVEGPDPFAPLMAYLHAAHDQVQVWSVIAQAYLWDIYASGETGLGGGISAMPSLHVAVATLWVLLARAYGRRLWTSLAALYLAVILIGSVHLGWHYAIDGYVGALGAVAAWGAAGWLVRRVVPPAPTEPPDRGGRSMTDTNSGRPRTEQAPP